METVKTISETNDLRFSTVTKDKEGNKLYINISLNDECKNGHQDFHITGNIYQQGKPKIEKYLIAGGCVHDEILAVKPEYKIFVKLHGCDFEGIPTYAVENGFYHLVNGFNNTKPEDKNFKGEFCDYYRITTDQFDILATSKNQLQYALNLQSLGILIQWKEEANKAIALLEEMTGKKFKVDSVKTQFHAPAPEQLKQEEERIATGYYTPEAEEQRETAKKQVLLSKLIKERDSKINEATEEFEAKKQVLLIGGEKALQNCIYYNHSKTLAFNWKSYDMISEELINEIIEKINLSGIKIENKKGK
jgi:hypothetical protein